MASPVKISLGVFAEPNPLLAPNFAHFLAAYHFVNVQPVLAVDVVAVDEAILPLHDPSLPPVPVNLSNVSEKMVVVVCPHALLPNTKEAMISKRRRDWLIPVLRKSFSIIILF